MLSANRQGFKTNVRMTQLMDGITLPKWFALHTTSQHFIL